MTFLGLAALVYYAVLLAAGVLSAAVMPQFVVTAVIFLSSGRLLRSGVRKQADNTDDESKKKPRVEPNWAFWTQILNWGMTLIILSILALWVMKPVGMPFLEFLQMKFFLGFVDHEASWNFVSQIPPP
jgi:hypothetical protein